MTDDLIFAMAENGCTGNPWQGFVCSETIFPKVVYDMVAIGYTFSYVMIFISMLLSMSFWMCSFRIDRDLTKSFLMPIAAPYSLLILIEIIHLIAAVQRRNIPKDQVVLTMQESEKFLHNVGHFTLIYAVSVYLWHTSSAARNGNRPRGQLARYYSYSAWYVFILLLFSVLSMGIFSPLPEKVSAIIEDLLSAFAIVGYFTVLLLWFTALTVYCSCYPHASGNPEDDAIAQRNHFRLGGALLFSVFILPGPLLRGVILIPWSHSTKSVLTSTYVLLRFLLPFNVFLLTFLFLPAYRYAAGLVCSCSCSSVNEENGPPIRQIHYSTDPTPGNFTNIEQRNSIPNGNHQPAVMSVNY